MKDKTAEILESLVESGEAETCDYGRGENSTREILYRGEFYNCFGQKLRPQYEQDPHYDI